MYRSIVITVLVSLLLVLGGGASSARAWAATPVPTPVEAEAVPNQLVVGFEEGADEAARDAALARHGGRTVKRLRGANARLVEVPDGGTKAASVRSLRAERGVRYVEPNYIYRSSLTPNDTYYSSYLWGMRNSGQDIYGSVGTAGADISAERAWDITTGSKAIVVGVTDSGVDYTHPDLAPNMWRAPTGWSLWDCTAGTHGYDAIADGCDPYDRNGHGTHVAGTIGARGNDGSGVTGVNWSVSIMALSFLDATGSGYLSDAVETINYAVEAKRLGINIRVLNASWGGGNSTALYDAIKTAGDNGILFVAAAGNGGSDGVGDNNDVTPTYPASYNLPNIISVAATDNRDGRAGFSNYGATSVDLGAPGVDILSTLPGEHGFFSGTSMAAPHVAGAAALVLAAPGLGGLTTAQLKQRLLDCGDPNAALSGRTLTGKRLNVHRAITGCIYNLTLSSTTGGTASATPTPGPYAAGTEVTLTATANSGYAFVGWTIDNVNVNGPNPYTLTMDTNHTVVARFVKRYTLTVTTSGAGTVSPGSGAHNAGTTVELKATPAEGYLFTGWTIDGVYQGWANPLTITMNGDRSARATFAARPRFTDVATTHPNHNAISQLAARGINRGYSDGKFGPSDTTLRAQMAAMIARAMGWDAEDRGNPFPDQGSVDAILWRNVGTLAHYNVAKGFPDGKYRPVDAVVQVQTISFITRGMVKRGYWQQVTVDNPALYPDVAMDSGHRMDVLTYHKYVGGIYGTTTAKGGWANWNTAQSTRAWFAEVEWRALESYYKVDRVP